MIHRTLKQSLQKELFQGKVLLVIGARQVGKSTMLKRLLKENDVPSIYLNADESDVLEAFETATTSTNLIQLFGKETKLVVIDEAQQIPDIGKKLKLVFDTDPSIQLIVTGSSAFDLQNESNEPLTGRKLSYHMYPISYAEYTGYLGKLEAKRLLETRILYGSYPDVINNPGKEQQILRELVNSYLYRDILQIDGIRKSSHLHKLVQALAFQLGSEVSYHELSNLIGNINSATVERYLDLLEKAFVIYKLPAYSRNLRNEIKKGKKYYFYDNGIRNTIINNFNPLNLRADKGALWENFMLAERLKHNEYTQAYYNTYFWRTHDGAEIDYLEESAGRFDAYEFKWKEKKKRFPASFIGAYPVDLTLQIHTKNYDDFIGL